MKNIKRGVLVLAVLLMLTGCVKSNNSLNINKDKSMDLNLSLKVSNELLNNISEVVEDFDINAIIEELKQEVKAKGYTLEKKDDKETVSVVLKKKFDDIDKLSLEKDVKLDLANIEDIDNIKAFKVTKGFLKNTYKADLYVKVDTDEILGSVNDIIAETPTSGDDETVTEENDGFDSAKLEELLAPFGGLEGVMNELSKIEVTFDVNLPSKYIYTNLDEKFITNDGKTLKFDFSDAIMGNNGDIAMQFEFDILNRNNLYIVLAAGGAAILITIIIVIASASKKKKAKAIASEPIHTEYDPSIAQNVANETAAAPVAQEQTGFVSNVPETPVVSVEATPVEPTLENTIPVAEEPVVPVVETSVPVYEVPSTPESQTFEAAAPVVAPPLMETPVAPVMSEATVMEASTAPVMEMPAADSSTEVAPVETTPVSTEPTAPVMSETPVMEVPVNPVMETSAETVIPPVAEVEVPTAPTNFEYTLPEETPTPVEVVPESQGPVFVPEAPVEAPVQQEVQEIKIDVPEAVDMNAQNIQ